MSRCPSTAKTVGQGSSLIGAPLSPFNPSPAPFLLGSGCPCLPGWARGSEPPTGRAELQSGWGRGQQPRVGACALVVRALVPSPAFLQAGPRKSQLCGALKVSRCVPCPLVTHAALPPSSLLRRDPGQSLWGHPPGTSLLSNLFGGFPWYLAKDPVVLVLA